MNYVRLVMHCEAACNEQAVSILSGSEVVYSSPMYIEYVDSDTETCLESSVNNLYTMNFTDTQNDGWYPGSFFKVYGKHGNIFFKYYQVSPTYETHLLSLHYAVDLNEVWKISESYYPGWNTYWFDDDAWSEEQLGAILGNYIATQYFRKPFTGIDNMASYEVRLKYRFGVVAYINGIEVYRDNMPEGEITPAMPCSSSYQVSGFHGFMRPGNEVNETQSILAVELHYAQTNQTILDFDSFVAFLAPSVVDSNCVVYPYQMDITISDSLVQNPDDIFDLDTLSFVSLVFEQNDTYSWTMTVSSSIVPLVNGLRYYSASSFNGFRHAVFAGVDRSVDYPLFTLRDLMYQDHVYYNYDSYFDASMYKQFRWTVYETFSTSYKEYEVMPMICRAVVPTSLELRGTDFVIFKDLEAVQIRPVNLDFSDCELSHPLPAGLTFNAQCCTISGTATESMPRTEFVMTSNAISPPVSGAFNLTVNVCTGTVLQVHRVYKSGAVNEGFIVYDALDEQNVYYSAPLQGSQRDEDDTKVFICSESNKIGVDLLSSGIEWATGSFLYIEYLLDEEQAMTLFRARYDTYLGLSASYIVPVNLPIHSADEWYYYAAGDIPDSWYLAGTVGWSSASKGHFSPSASRVQLYKKTFSIASEYDYSGLQVSVQYQYGCAIYLNGIEVFKNGIAEVSATVNATNFYPTLSFHSVTLPAKMMIIDNERAVSYLQRGSNTIAIALISDSDTNVNSTFDAAVLLFQDDRNSRVFSYSVSYEGPEQIHGSPFDHSYISYMSSRQCGENAMIITFDNDRREWISSFLVQTRYNELDRLFSSFSVLAKNAEDAEWTFLNHFANLTWSLVGQTKRMWLANNKPYNQYKFANFSASSGCDWLVNRVDLYIDQIYQQPILGAGWLSYPSTSAYKNIELVEVCPSSDKFKDFTIEPPLPAGLHFCSATGWISGTPTEESAQQRYMIQAKRASGEGATAMFNLEVVVCTDGRALITTKITSTSSVASLSYKLLQGRGDTGNVIYAVPVWYWISSVIYDDRCLADGFYTFFLEGSITSNDPTRIGFTLSVDQGDFVFALNALSYSSTSSIASSSFSSYLPFQIEFASWKMLKSLLAVPDWTQRDFDDASWDSVRVSEMGSTPYVTTYFRKTFSIPSLADYQVLNIRARFSGGLVGYFNAKRVVRINMPDVFDELTSCYFQRSASEFAMFHIVLGLSGAVAGDNVLAFEVHRFQGEGVETPVQFDATGVFGVEICSRVVDSYAAISGPQSTTDSLSLFDAAVDTGADFHFSVGSQIFWSVVNQEGSIYNSYAIYAGPFSSTFRFSLLGSTEADTEPIILTSETLAATAGATLRFYSSSATLLPFRYFRWRVESAIYVSLYELFFFYCKGTGSVCAADGAFPSVASGQLSPAVCDYGFDGYKYRECVNGVLQSEVHTERCIHKIPVNLAYETGAMELVRDTFVQKRPSFDYIITRFSVDPALPAGLSLNETTGAIEGVPREIAELRAYLITGENAIGAAQTQVWLSVRVGYCRVDGFFGTVDVGKEFVYDCSLQGGFVGTQRRKCVIGETDGEWQEVEGSCVSVITLMLILIVAVLIIIVIILLLVKMPSTTSKKKRSKKKLKIVRKPKV